MQNRGRQNRRSQGSPNNRSRHPHYQRKNTNPVNVFLAIVGVGLLTGLIIICSMNGSHGTIVEQGNPSISTTKINEKKLLSRISQLNNFSGSPDEGYKKAQQLFTQAKTTETEQKILLLLNKFAGQKAKLLRKELEALKPEIISLSEKGEFRKAHNRIKDFKRKNEKILKRDVQVVKLLNEELNSLSDDIELSRQQLSQKNLALLKIAIKEDNFDTANTLYGDLKIKGCKAEQLAADKVWDDYFAGKRREDLAKLEQNKSGTPDNSLSGYWKRRQEAEKKQQEKTTGTESSTGGTNPPEGTNPGQEKPAATGKAPGESEGAAAGGEKEGAGDFFGEPGAKNDDTKGSANLPAKAVSVFSTLGKSSTGEFSILIKGKKVKLTLSSFSKIYIDKAMSQKTYLEDIKPQTSILILAETREFRLGGPEGAIDPTKGKRITKSELLLYGDDPPARAVWNDPKRIKLLWYTGKYVKLQPPALFSLNGTNYLMLGAPRYIVKRTKIDIEALGRGLVFVKGKATGLGPGEKETGKLTVESLIYIPKSNVIKTPYYISLLKEPVY